MCLKLPKNLKMNLLHPYHIERLQRLTELEYRRRVAFCKWYQHRKLQQPGLVSLEYP